MQVYSSFFDPMKDLSILSKLPFDIKKIFANSGSFVAVHGLQGDAIRTWTHEKSQVCWLRDLLPAHIQEARVLSWGYFANTNSWDGKTTTSDRILHHAETLIEELQIDREVS